MSDEPIALIQLVLALFGWPINRLARWVDRQPQRDFSQLSIFGKIGRLILMIADRCRAWSSGVAHLGLAIAAGMSRTKSGITQ
jgi:hypothetical protein